MWKTSAIVVSIALLYLVVPTTSIAQVKSRLPKSPEELALSITVDEALEEGPLVCTVTLKNLSKDTLVYYTWSSWNGGWCRIDAGWRERQTPPIRTSITHGNPGPYRRELGAGQTISQKIHFQKYYLSIPSGKAKLRFGWNLYRPNQDKETQSFKALETLFEFEAQQTIDIKPATAENVAAALRAREAEFARVLDLDERDSSRTRCIGCEWDRWLETINGCRHREFVPLLTRALGHMSYGYTTQQLISTIYESFDTPDKCFAVLADHLSSPQPGAAEGVLWHWVREEQEHESSKKRQEKLKAARVKSSDKQKEFESGFSLEMTKLEEEAWQSSKRHFDIRLTKEQFARLLAIKDVWVRALLYAHFPDRCPNDWAETLCQDLKRLVRPPEGIAQLVAQLDDDNFRVRERATQELFDACRAFNRQLWEVREDKLSAEAIERLRSVRRRLENAKLPELWLTTINQLAWQREPHTKKMLDILRTSDHRNQISAAAQKAYAERQKSN